MTTPRPPRPPIPSGPVTLAVTSTLDAGRARREARELAQALGFSREDTEAVAIATSELATNLARYAPGGAITLTPLAPAAPGGPPGLRLESTDAGPGIADTGAAMQDGFSTGGGLGGGLGGVKRLMDEFQLTSSPDGTHVIAVKWATRRRDRL